MIDLRQNLLNLWNIPPMIRDMLNVNNAERTRNIILDACLDIAERSDHGWWDEDLMASYIALSGVENTPVDTVIATTHANAARAARHCNWLPVPPAATWGPMIPGPWPPEPDDEEDEKPLAADPAVGTFTTRADAKTEACRSPPNLSMRCARCRTNMSTATR
jgi:hypothetical protein